MTHEACIVRVADALDMAKGSEQPQNPYHAESEGSKEKWREGAKGSDLFFL